MNSVPTYSKLALASLALGALIAVGCGDKHPAPVGAPAPIVQVAVPVQREVTDYQIFTARTQAEQSVDIKARVTGYLDDFKFKDGDMVKKGQVLFVIDKRPYKAALDKAVAQVEVSKAALEKAQANYDIGLRVQKEQKNAISEQELAKRKGERDEARGSVDEAKALVENAQLNYDWCEVTSPLTGRVNRHFIDVGNLVSADVTTLTNIVSLKPTWAYFDVDQNTMLSVQKLIMEGKLKSAREDEVEVQMALSGDKGFPFNGVIDFVSNQLDPNTGSLRVRAVFPNKDEKLAAGLFGRIRVPITAPHKALLVSDLAVGTDQGQKYVLVVNDQDVVEYRPVETGLLHDGLREVMRFRTVIESDPEGKQTSREVEVLKPTDRLIVNGLQRVRPGIKVDPRQIDMETLLLEKDKGPAKKAAK
ncbi:MAG: efflux RND transporter periplasmic adaptor subunit [Gemmataceae bacterium]|nr:efflux RND transporter periplasmic adaptor subunit [Gemmataceae bacterium]